MRGTVVAHLCATDSTRERAMTLRFVGIGPDAGGGGSPTAWVGEEGADLVLQGEEAEARLKAMVGGTEWGPVT
ncbi:hypothetical protein GCM10010446_45080 [Streptomyces enissocaesilis]|uniref:Uncharacterized protein n=1 Tax=Streptomyces enissocaesilis TaxID=332589 RepID=A0ABN3XH17_9ACTN